jgi:hypothetical protein
MFTMLFCPFEHTKESFFVFIKVDLNALRIDGNFGVEDRSLFDDEGGLRSRSESGPKRGLLGDAG